MALRELYVYYRVAEEALPAALAAVRAFQTELAQEHPALQARLLRRPELREGQVTLMETYALPGGIPAGLAERIAAGTPALPAPRHVEAFETL